VRSENENFAPATLKHMLLEWADKTLDVVTGIQDGIIQELDDYYVPEQLDAAAEELERIARGLRALRSHAKFPPEEVTIEPYVWAVSGNRGRSLRVTESEFTARRHIQTSNNLVMVYRLRPNGVRPAPGTDIVFGSIDPATMGWELVARG
jgi:hypothetical protein